MDVNEYYVVVSIDAGNQAENDEVRVELDNDEGVFFQMMVVEFMLADIEVNIMERIALGNRVNGLDDNNYHTNLHVRVHTRGEPQYVINSIRGYLAAGAAEEGFNLNYLIRIFDNNGIAEQAHFQHQHPQPPQPQQGGRKVYTARNGAKYIRLANGQTRFVKRY